MDIKATFETKHSKIVLVFDEAFILDLPGVVQKKMLCALEILIKQNDMFNELAGDDFDD